MLEDDDEGCLNDLVQCIEEYECEMKEKEKQKEKDIEEIILSSDDEQPFCSNVAQEVKIELPESNFEDECENRNESEGSVNLVNKNADISDSGRLKDDNGTIPGTESGMFFSILFSVKCSSKT